MSTIEAKVTYTYQKGIGWVPRTRTGRSAEETKNLKWSELRTGDAVYVIANGIKRIARVHQKGEPLKLNPDDTGSWLYVNDVDGHKAPYQIHPFEPIRNYPKHDRAWTELVGVSFPDGEDYV